jgi:ParB family chromosome partitioning protein
MSESSSRSSEPKQRLGRGLAALLGDATQAQNGADAPQGVKKVPIEFLRSNPKNPRRTFSEPELEDLAASIREHGIIQPIAVRALAGVSDAYEIVAGERRWRAAQKAGQHDVPIITLEIGDREALEIAIVENVQRADLNALEEAGGYARLATDYGYSHNDIARVVGKSRSHVANTLRLTALPEHTKELLASGAITAGHARALLSTPDPDALADLIVKRGLTVRDVEELARQEAHVSSARTRNAVSKDANIKALESQIALSLGADVELRVTGSNFEIRLRTKGLDQFNYICDHLMNTNK